MSFVYFVVMAVCAIILVACAVSFVIAIHEKDKGTRNGSLTGGTVVLIFGAVFSILMLFGSVSRGHVGVMTTFGEVNLGTIKPEGFYTKSPIVDVYEMTNQRRSVRRVATTDTKEQNTEVIALAKNEVRLTMDVEFPYQLNPRYAPLVFRYLGDDKRYEEELIFKASAKALRDGVSEFDANEAYQSKRVELNDRVTELFADAILAQLKNLDGFRGLPEKELRNVIHVQPVQITRIEPPAKILNAIEERASALQDLERQKTLTKIAEEIATRRKNEGTGISNFLGELPKNVSVADAIQLLRASADMQRAQALGKAVDDGKVPVIYLSGDTAVAVK